MRALATDERNNVRERKAQPQRHRQPPSIPSSDERDASARPAAEPAVADVAPPTPEMQTRVTETQPGTGANRGVTEGRPSQLSENVGGEERDATRGTKGMQGRDTR